MTGARVHRIDRATQKVVARSPRLPVEGPERLQVVGGTLWVDGWVRIDEQNTEVRIYALDATTLAERAGSLSEKQRHVAGADALFSLQFESSRAWLIRRDPSTGKVLGRSEVTVTCNPPYAPAYVIAVDQAVGVVWVACHSRDELVTLIALDSETGRERGRAQLGEGIHYSALGRDGTLWVILVPLPSQFAWWPRRPAQYFHLAPDAGRMLPISGFQQAERLKPTFGLRLVEAGSRLLLQTQGEQAFSCMGRRTGALLETYPAAMRREEDTSALVGDDREIYTTTGNEIIVRRGPDKCLS